MVTESPPVSPSVVAAILITQNVRVTSGTLLRIAPLAECGTPISMSSVLNVFCAVVHAGDRQTLRRKCRCKFGDRTRSNAAAAAGRPVTVGQVDGGPWASAAARGMLRSAGPGARGEHS